MQEANSHLTKFASKELSVKTPFNPGDPKHPDPDTVRHSPLFHLRLSRYPLPFSLVTLQIPFPVVYRYYSDPRSDSDVRTRQTYVSD